MRANITDSVFLLLDRSSLCAMTSIQGGTLKGVLLEEESTEIVMGEVTLL